MDLQKNPSRTIYVAMALLFVATALVGFVPTSLGLIQRVAAGQQALPPLILHFHAATMTLWLLLLLAQSLLMYTKRAATHKKLGLASLILAPLMMISMLGVEMMNVRIGLGSTAAFVAQPDAQFMRNISTALLIHSVTYLFFPVFFLWAMLTRNKDPQAHKRLMILATVVLMIPALGRLLSVTQVLPDFGLHLVDARHFYMLLLLVPAIVYDIVQQGRPHLSYMIGVELLSIWIVIAHFLWDSAWWAEFAPKLLGV